MSIAQLNGVVTVRLQRAGFHPQTGKPAYTRQIVKFAEYRDGDIINVPKVNGNAGDVLKYIASKLNLSEDQLTVSEWNSYWQVRRAIGETI